MEALDGTGGWLAFDLASAQEIIRFFFALNIRTGFARAELSVIVKVFKFFPFNPLPMSGI